MPRVAAPEPQWLPTNATPGQVQRAATLVLEVYGWSVFTSPQEPGCVVATKLLSEGLRESEQGAVLWLAFVATGQRASDRQQRYFKAWQSVYWGLTPALVSPDTWEAFLRLALPPKEQLDPFKLSMTRVVTQHRALARANRKGSRR